MTPGRPVLIADDEPTIAKLYGAVLVDCGFNIVLASDGQEAYEKILAHRPSLIMTDMQMPRMDGSDLLRALDAAGERRCPVIVLTGDDRPEVWRQGLVAGADDFVVKGISLSLLRHSVRFWLGSGFRRLPLIARRKADRLLEQLGHGPLLRVERQIVDEDMVERAVAALLLEMKHLPDDFGERLIERIWLMAGLSALILSDCDDPVQCLHFPFVLVAALNRLNQSWLPDAPPLLRRFDQLAADPRFVMVFEEGLGAVEVSR